MSLTCYGRRARLPPRAMAPSTKNKNSFGQPAPVDVHRQMKLMMSHFEEQKKMLEKRLARLEHDARQPRLAMEADRAVNTKTRERTEGAATVVQAIHGDSCTAQKVQDGPKTSISFGVKPQEASR